MTQIIPHTNFYISREELKDPTRIISPERVSEANRIWHSEKIDENHYKVTKTQYWAGAIALGTALFLGIVDGIKNMSRLIGHLE